MRDIAIKITLTVISLLFAVGSLFLTVCAVKNSNKGVVYMEKDGKYYYQSDLVKVYETTGNKSKLLVEGNDLFFGGATQANTQITINKNKKFQQVKAIGAAMTHASAYNINRSAYKDEMLKALFSPTEGAGFNIIRVPIGTSDYGTYVNGTLAFYTLCDIEEGEDLELEHFSIQNDLVDLIPVIKAAYEINPKLQVLLAPWSAPAWMKSSKRLQSGFLLEEYEEVYANYLVKAIMAYEAEGIKVNYLSILNEPEMHPSTYPVMNMPIDQQIRVTKLVGQKLKENKLEVKIMTWDHNTDNYQYPLELLGDKEANKYVSGVAFHGYYGDIFDHAYAYQQIKDNYPNKEIYFTEITAGDWSVDFASNISYALVNAILGTFNNHGSIVTYWNLVLDENNMPFFGGAGNCHGLLTKALDDTWYSKSAEYYALMHVSKFINVSEHKTHVIDSYSTNDMIVATSFLRDDGKIILVVLNTSDLLSEEVEIKYNGRYFSYEIMPQSVVTFVWEG